MYFKVIIKQVQQALNVFSAMINNAGSRIVRKIMIIKAIACICFTLGQV